MTATSSSTRAYMVEALEKHPGDIKIYCLIQQKLQNLNFKELNQLRVSKEYLRKQMSLNLVMLSLQFM